jgi:hypothetical protein
MIAVDQEFVHDLSIGQQGDCFRACVASILELPISEVPHFAQLTHGSSSAAFWNMAYDWLEERGYEYTFCSRVNRPGRDKAEFHMLTGLSPRGNGTYHCVVAQGGVIVHDPHPTHAGLAGDAADWRWNYLTKMKATA